MDLRKILTIFTIVCLGVASYFVFLIFQEKAKMKTELINRQEIERQEQEKIQAEQKVQKQLQNLDDIAEELGIQNDEKINEEKIDDQQLSVDVDSQEIENANMDMINGIENMPEEVNNVVNSEDEKKVRDQLDALDQLYNNSN